MPQADDLRQRAVQAHRAWTILHTSPFHPLCLTLYLNNTCNLKCAYCFSDPGAYPPAHLSLEILQAAAGIVAANCQASRRPMTVVFHGGGEPTLDHALIFQALDWLEDLAARRGLTLFRYLATNGVMSEHLAAQIATRFDLIGLSCDGPPEIQDRQRPLQKAGRHTSSWYVEQTAQVVHSVGKPLHVRVTVTPETLQCQADLADYICRQLKPEEIHVEPIYAGGRAGPGLCFEADQAEAYVRAFFGAQSTARRYGVNWLASGSRPAEIHTGYCHIWRNVLNLTPEGVATACFELSQAEAVRKRGVELGGWDAADGSFDVELPRIHKLRQALRKEPEACITCFNRYHCVRQCPDSCLLEEGAQTGGFRCRVEAMITDAMIRETAGRLSYRGGDTDEITSGPVGRDLGNEPRTETPRSESSGLLE